jgi:hypothetical protein
MSGVLDIATARRALVLAIERRLVIRKQYWQGSPSMSEDLLLDSLIR